MNKIYKVIWSKTNHCYVVTSELAKRNGKGNSSLRKKLLTAVLMTGIICSMSGNAWALTEDATGQFISESSHPGRTDSQIAIGKDAGITRNGNPIDMATFTGGYSIAIGYHARNFTYGQEMTDHYYANTKNSIAIGYEAHTHAANAFAIGVSTDATAERSFAIGTTSTDVDTRHAGARAGGQGSIAFGDQAVISVNLPSTSEEKEKRGTDTAVNDSIAVGTNSWVQARNAVALGSGMSYTYHDISGNSMINKTVYYDGSAWIATAEGTGAQVGEGADGGIAIGSAVGTVDEGSNKSYFPAAAPGAVTGYTAAAKIEDGATRAVAVGSGVIIGSGAENSVAVGAKNVVTGKNSTAVGQANEIAGSGSGVFGDPSYVSGDYSYSFGHDNKIGKMDITSGNLQSDSSTTDAFVMGGNNEIGNANGNVAFLNVLGSSNKVEGADGSVIIGKDNEVTNQLIDSLLAGNSNTGLDGVSDSQIIGNFNTIGANVSNIVLFGNNSSVAGGVDSAIVIGQGAVVDGNMAIAIGAASQAKVADSVALGSNSVAGRIQANGGRGAGYDVVTGTYYSGVGAQSATWLSTLAAVSVGGDSSNGAIGSAAVNTRQITGVAAGTADTDAVNVAQLKRARVEVKAGNNVEVNTDYAADGHTIYTIHALNAIVKAGDNIVVDEQNGSGTGNGASNTGNPPTTGGSTAGISPAPNAHTTTYNVSAQGDGHVAAGDTKLVTGDTVYTEVVQKGINFSGDSGQNIHQDMGETLNIKGNAAGELTDGNIGVEADGKDTLIVKLNKDVNLGEDGSLKMGNTIIGKDSVTIAGGPTLSNDGNNLKVADKEGKAAKITNVRAGEADTDAVNVGQLKQATQNIEGDIAGMNNRVSRLGDRVNKVGAGAAALAALHPMDFDPDDKLIFAAGVGNYRNQTAGAVGMFYRPDEKVMFSLGGTVGNGENMVNAGVSFSLDRVNRITHTRTAMAHEIMELRNHIAQQDNQIAQLTALVNKLVASGETLNPDTGLVSRAVAPNPLLFPDVPENHWAYEYLEDLQKRGIVEGYPDGTFAGDRTMTRYEYAAMLDRALLKGEKLSERILDEFGAELSRVRVDRISGEDKDRHKIERVRVNNEETKKKDVYGSDRSQEKDTEK